MQTVSVLKMSKIEIRVSKENIGTVFCECGEEIPIVIDLEEMVSYIQEHAEIHKQRSKAKGKKEYDRIEQQLTEKILLKIARDSRV